MTEKTNQKIEKFLDRRYIVGGEEVTNLTFLFAVAWRRAGMTFGLCGTLREAGPTRLCGLRVSGFPVSGL
jgi:hypothetical protein